MSKHAYYAKRYADALKPVVDSMLADRTVRVFKCSQYQMALRSLEKLINSAFLYLADKDETEDKRYARFRLAVKVQKVKAKEGDCVIVRFKVPQFTPTPNALPALDTYTGAKVTIIDPKAKEPNETPPYIWVDGIDTFIEGDERELKMENLYLKPESIQAIRQTLSGLEGIVEIVVLDTTILYLRKI